MYQLCRSAQGNRDLREVRLHRNYISQRGVEAGMQEIPAARPLRCRVLGLNAQRPHCLSKGHSLFFFFFCAVAFLFLSLKKEHARAQTSYPLECCKKWPHGVRDASE